VPLPCAVETISINMFKLDMKTVISFIVRSGRVTAGWSHDSRLVA